MPCVIAASAATQSSAVKDSKHTAKPSYPTGQADAGNCAAQGLWQSTGGKGAYSFEACAAVPCMRRHDADIRLHVAG